MKGLIHIYHGYGKGKTTAAVGLAIRFLGYDKKVVFTQFLKGSDSGEIKILKNLGTTVMRNSRDYGFFPYASLEDKEAMTAENNRNLSESIVLALSGKCDLLVLDEILDALSVGAVNKEIFENFIKEKPEKLELVLTGRNPSEFLIEKADYITFFDKQKHPFDKGVKARESVEY
ncbi:MAG TPA: cob(I)yrinic acid a,c-diamide adenosyltransferase [Clostridia bacterium]|nr:cob(I)yrinic acid a,c-diamide adenosyltransferase [Clostridia bacterium]